MSIAGQGMVSMTRLTDSYARRSRRHRGKRACGSVAVEFAIVAPMLIIFMFGAIEFGLIFKDMLTLNQAAREASRTAAVGKSTSEIVSKMTAAAATLRTGDITYYLERGVYNGSTGAWTYTTLGDTATTPVRNDALSGDQVRVRLEYPHRLVTGGLFSRLANAQNGTAIRLRGTMVMRRE